MPPYLLRRLLVAGASIFVCLGVSAGFSGPRLTPLSPPVKPEPIAAVAETTARKKGKGADARALRITEILTRLNDMEAAVKAESPGLAIDDRTVAVDPVAQPLLVEYHALMKELESLLAESGAEPGERAPISSVEIEPNNTSAAATPLDLMTQPAAIVDGAITPSNDDDYYSFSAPAGSTVWAIVDTGSPPAATGTSRDSVLTLFSTDGTTTIEMDDDDGTGNGCDGNIESTLASVIAGRPIASAGTYYLRVEAFSTGTIIPYRLYVVVTTATPTAESESNDSTGTADSILAYGSTVGLASGTIGSASDEDFFSFQVKAGDIVFVAVDGDPERNGTSTNVDFQLRDSSSAANLINVDSSANSGGVEGEGVCYAITATGTYYVAVTGRGNSTGTYRVLVVDTDGENEPCTITCASDVSVESAPGQCGATVTYTAPAADELCGTVTCSPASGSFFPVGTTTVTCSTTAGPSCSFDVTVTDGEAPALVCPGNVTATASGESCEAVVTYAAPTVTDNCSGAGAPVCSPASGSTFPVGTTTVTCTATDVAGNIGSCSFTVTVNDTQAPSIACPQNVTVSNDQGQCGAVVTYATPQASDACSQVGATVCSPASGSFFPVGTTTVTCTATDSSGNTGSCSFTVTVEDTQAPSIACPSNVTVSNDAGQCSAVVTYATPTASDNCSGMTTVVCSPASGSTFAVGTTTVTCTATDPAGQSASCTFTVTVNDTQGPAVTCPANVTVSSAPGQCSAVVAYATPTATDNCGGEATVSCLPASGSTFAVGTTTVTCTASDALDNTTTCTFTVTVNDTDAPSIACPSNVTVANDAGQCGATVAYATPTTSDNCGGKTAVVCSPASGSFFPIGTTTVSCTATDASGNTAMCSFTVTVTDAQAPTISCPSNVAVANTPGQCGASVNYAAPTTSDNCAGMTTVVCSPASGSFFPVGMTTVTCTATDPSGNSASCSFTVTVNDTQAPSIACPANIVVTGDQLEGCSLSAVVDYPAPTTADNCGVASVVCSPASGSVFTQGTTTVTCTVTDTSGNASACSFTVTVGGEFGVCAVDDVTGDRFSQIVDQTSPLYGYWQYRIAATGEILCGVANYVSYIPGRTLVTYDNDDPRCFMNANLNLAGAGTVRVVDHEPNRQLNIRDRNTRNNGPCN